jgi:hypothetical protein
MTARFTRRARLPGPMAALLLAVPLAGMLAGMRPLSAAAQGISVRVAPGRSLGELPRTYRPSAMLSWADADAVNAFLALPGPLGTVRVTLEPLLSDTTSLEDFRNRLTGSAGTLKRLSERGADIIITVARMPRWLATRDGDSQVGPNGYSVREASPPRDDAGMQELGFTIASVLSRVAGQAAWYEFWNEPESPNFWSGSSEALFRAYEAFARGVRRADPAAKVGGVAVGGWNDPRAGEPGQPLLRAFIQRVAHGVPLDFVSWHNFSSQPEEGWIGAASVREWLRSAGLPPQLPQFVTEWNRWKTFPEWLDPGRDTAEGAAFFLASTEAIEKSGIRGHTFAALQDFNAMGRDHAFGGDFGLVTRGPMVGKASFCAVQMLARLGSARVAVDLGADAAAEGVGALATADAQRISLLVYRYGGDAAGVAVRVLRQSGYESAEALALTSRQLGDFMQRRAELPGGVAPAARAVLERARAAAERARDQPMRGVSVLPAVEGASGRYRIYRIDESNCNAGETYMRLRGQGQPHDMALAGARRVEMLRAQAEGSGPLPPLNFGPYGAALVEIDAGQAR